MKLRDLLSATALSSVAFVTPSVAWAADPAPAAAQIETPAQTPEAQARTRVPGDPADTDDTAGPDIVVTGSRIFAPNNVSTAPITSVSAAEIQSHATVSVGDILNNLPQLQSTFSQANSTRFLGTGGLNLLDLYGLGTQRTLVLVNGRRHVGADILNNAVSPDVNTFPTDLIERVDITTGGDSAVYGSDAIAGVVNFVLKDSFDGLQFRGQGGVSEKGDAGSYYASVLAGKNFAEGRGNIAVDLEYARQNSFFASDRDNLRFANAFVTVDTDQAGLGTTQPNSTINSDGIPDAVFFNDVRSATINFGGLVAIPGLAGRCGNDPFGRPYTCDYIFNPDGSLVPQTGTRIGISGGSAASPTATPAGSFLGGNGDTRRDGPLIQILPQLDRYSANLVGHFEVSPAFVPFVEASYVRTNSFSQGGSGPAFFTGGTIGGAGTSEQPRLDNPFLSTQARGVLTTQFLSVITAGFDPATGAAYTPTVVNGVVTVTVAQKQAAAAARVNSGAYQFILRRNLIDLGYRSEAAKRETYRIVGGVKGTFNSDWHYEVSGNYGEFVESTKVLGNVNVQRELLSLDAARNAAGQIVCAAQLTGTARAATSIANATSFNDDPNGLVNADVAACVPYNPFGLGDNAAARAYIAQDTISRGKITQLDVTANLSGDTSGFFNLPGGAIGFAVGGEYRRETNFFREDPLVEAGYTFYNAIAAFTPPAFEVKEAFGEIRLPILKDVPFFSQLTVTGSGRISDYKGSAGTVYTYNGGVIYSPIRDITFRGSYARAVRAPNLSELFSAQSQNFAPGFIDPCASDNIARGTQFRAANCLAAGVPTTFNYVYAQSLQIVSGGNPDLNVEKSDSYTAGILLQPRFIPGLSLSADYYNIKVNNVITSVAAQGIANNCYDSPTLNNPFCSSFTRVGAGGTGPRGEQAFRIIEGSLLQSTLNFAALRSRGINVVAAYTHRFGSVKLNMQIDYTHQIERANFTNPADPTFGDNLLGEIGVPKDAANWNINADFGPVFINTQLRYLSKMSVGAIENHEAYQGRAAQNLDDFDIPFYPEVFYADMRFGINIAENRGNFYFGVDNLTNRVPPLSSTGIGGGTAIYEPVGRRFYAGVTAKF